MMVALVQLAAGFVLLYLGGEGLIRGALGLGIRFGISPLVAGLTIVAFGTSAPELAVTLDAALAGLGGLAVGNVVGSNICNIALILGLVATLRPPKIEAKLLREDVPIVIGSSGLLAFMLLNGGLSRLEGLVLFSGIVAYIVFTVRGARRESIQVQAEYTAGLAVIQRPVWQHLGMAGAGLVALMAGGHLFVLGGEAVAIALGVPPAVIGLTIVAVGTSLPEIASSLVAAYRGHGDLAIGNVVGSNIFNALAIMGTTATVAPLNRGAVGLGDIGLMLVLSVLLWPMMWSRTRIERWEGLVLLAIYAAYLTIQFNGV